MSGTWKTRGRTPDWRTSGYVGYEGGQLSEAVRRRPVRFCDEIEGTS